MAQQNYNKSEFVSVRYYAGVYGCAASSARISYYGMSGTPNQMFNGTHQIVGAAPADADGAQYMDIIRSKYFDPTPVRVQVQSFERAAGDVSAEVTMYSETESLVDETFLLILMEDRLTVKHTHVTRASYTETFSLTGAGNTATFNHSFVIDPSWNSDQLYVVAFVQRQNKEIINVGSSHPQPDFSVRAMVPFGRNQIGPSVGTIEGEYFTVMNVGQTDTFTISAVIDEAPPGRAVSFKDEAGTTYTDPLPFGLNEQASTTFKAVVVPSSPGFMRYHFEVTSTNLTKTLEIPFVYITDDVDALLVDDDGGVDFDQYFTAAIIDAGLTYGVWDRGGQMLNADVLANIDLLVWNTGVSYPSIDRDDRIFLNDYLDSGKGLFVSGQDVGWDLNTASSGNADIAWYESRLHADYVTDDTNKYLIDGVAGDPVTDGLLLTIEGGDGADNSDYPSRIAALGDGTEILTYQGVDWGAGVRSTDSVTGAKVVYVSFGFEAINRADDRSSLLGNAINWMLGRIFVDDFESGDSGAWSGVVD